MVAVECDVAGGARTTARRGNPQRIASLIYDTMELDHHSDSQCAAQLLQIVGSSP